MAHVDLTFSIMDTDLVGSMMRSILALHQADAEGDCFACRDVSPCATVRIVASHQEAAVARVADPRDVAWEKFMKRPPAPQKVTADSEPFRRDLAVMRESGSKTHRFKYPECPEFSGGICTIHHGQAVAGVA